jgi:predicted RNase H-like HicB family nuclease
MSLIPELVTDNSNEPLFHIIRPFQIESTASSGESGTTAFNGNFGYEPQVSASALSGVGMQIAISITEPSFAGTATLSNPQSLKTSRWFSMRSSAVFSTMASDGVSFADVRLEPQEAGGFVAFSGEYPGAVGQGETEQETLKDLQDAISLLREVLEEDQERTGR